MRKFLLAILLLQNLFCSAQTVVFNPEKDNSIFSENGSASNGLGNLFAGPISGGNKRRALLKFDLSSIPAGAVILSSALTLNCNMFHGSADDLSLYKLTDDWGEGTSFGLGQGAAATTNDVTWITRFFNIPATNWTTNGGDFIASSTATTNVSGPGLFTWNSAQMDADVQDWVNTPAANFGWILLGDETQTRSAKRFDSKESATNMPELSVTYSIVTPVNLISFTGAETKTGVLLKWITAQESDNDFFQPEVSNDGIHFLPLGRINGAGTSSIQHNYQFLHNTVQPATYFYRLGQISSTAVIKYSAVIAVNCKEKHTTLVIRPNPVSDKINLPSFGNQDVLYAIINTNGLIIKQGHVANNAVNVSSLSPGYYLLRIIKPGASILSGGFIKQ